MQDAGRPLRNFDLVTIAASVGGLSALGRVLGALPREFPAPVVVVQHRGAGDPGCMEELLAHRTPLAVSRVGDGDRLAPGRVYVAPADRHVLVGEGGVLSLSDGAKVNHCRPSADPLFDSAAARHGARALAVVLTGR